LQRSRDSFAERLRDGHLFSPLVKMVLFVSLVGVEGALGGGDGAVLSEL
jgi:hypothetical protein